MAHKPKKEPKGLKPRDSETSKKKPRFKEEIAGSRTQAAQGQRTN